MVIYRINEIDVVEFEIFDLLKFSGNVERGFLKGGKYFFVEFDSSVFFLKGINFFLIGLRVSFFFLCDLSWN